MSDIRDLIKETNKTTRKSRMINNILWLVVVVLVTVSLYITYVAIDLKHQAEESELLVKKERDSKSELLIVKESLLEELKISEENLQGEKEKLEQYKIENDSLRQVQLEQLEQGDELWNYTLEQNTVQGYSDYIQIKGSKTEAVDNIKTLLQKTGYVMIQESNGNMLIEPSGEGFWKSKSARSIRNGVIGVRSFRNTSRNGDVILKGQVFVILQDSIMSGKTRWAKISY